MTKKNYLQFNIFGTLGPKIRKSIPLNLTLPIDDFPTKYQLRGPVSPIIFSFDFIQFSMTILFNIQ